MHQRFLTSSMLHLASALLLVRTGRALHPSRLPIIPSPELYPCPWIWAARIHRVPAIPVQAPLRLRQPGKCSLLILQQVDSAKHSSSLIINGATTRNHDHCSALCLPSTSICCFKVINISCDFVFECCFTPEFRYDIIKASSSIMTYSINMQGLSTAVAVNTGLISLSQLEKVKFEYETINNITPFAS